MYDAAESCNMWIGLAPNSNTKEAGHSLFEQVFKTLRISLLLILKNIQTIPMERAVYKNLNTMI
jgi:hypothetical protein